jgi:carboxyl-terminal processing protease
LGEKAHFGPASKLSGAAANTPARQNEWKPGAAGEHHRHGMRTLSHPSAIARRFALLVIALVLLSGALVIVRAERPGPAAAAGGEEEVRLGLQRFAAVYSLVEQNYAGPLDANKAVFNGAIPGMLRVLDPHSTFFDPQAYADLEEEQTGLYEGVGMTIGSRNGQIIVVSPTVGTPAFAAGVHPGDMILAIDGKPTAGMNTSDVASRVRGPRGTKVRLTLLRPGDAAAHEVSLVRTAIPRDSISVAFAVRPGVGYLHVQRNDGGGAGQGAQAVGPAAGADPRFAAGPGRAAGGGGGRGGPLSAEGGGDRLAAWARLAGEGL